MTPQNPDSQYPFDDYLLGLPGEDLAEPPWDLDLLGVHFEDPRDLWRCDPLSRELYDRIMRQVWPLVTRGLQPARADGAYYLVDIGRRLQPVAGHLAFTTIPLRDQEEFLTTTGGLFEDYVDCQIIDCPIPPVRQGGRSKPNAGWIRHKFVHELTSWLVSVLSEHDADDHDLGMPRLLSGQHPWTLAKRNRRVHSGSGRAGRKNTRARSSADGRS